MEGLLKSYTQGVFGLDDKNYWERLHEIRLNSIQKRMERYRIMYIWKVVSEKVPNLGLKWDENCRRGEMVTITPHKSNTPVLAKNMIDQSLAVHGGRLFNLLPEKLRSYIGIVEGFKTQLDEFLMNIPDQPICKDIYPEPISKESCKNSNLLLDWIPHLNIRERRTCSNHIQLD